MPTNELVPFFKPGENVTGYLTVALSGKTLVACVPGGRGGQPHIAKPAAGSRVFGALGHDGIAGESVHVNVGGIVPVVAAADIAAGKEVATNADGHITVLAAGQVAVGYAVASGASGSAVPIKLYG